MGGICCKQRKINLAICSRDSEENYQWLQNLLEKEIFQPTKVDVHPVYISNNANEFYEEAPHHDFVILYHTKKRGRVNITNVTDSLYDEELKYLHDKLGRKKVVVVIDDLDESNGTEKSRIQEAQEDLRKHACNIFLFSEADKNHINGSGIVDRELEKKLKDLKKAIKPGSRYKGLRKKRRNIKILPSRKTQPAEPTTIHP